MDFWHEIKGELLDFILLIIAIGFLVWIFFWSMESHVPNRYYGLNAITISEGLNDRNAAED